MLENRSISTFQLFYKRDGKRQHCNEIEQPTKESGAFDDKSQAIVYQSTEHTRKGQDRFNWEYNLCRSNRLYYLPHIPRYRQSIQRHIVLGGKVHQIHGNCQEENSKNGLDVFYFTYKSIDDSINESTSGDIIFITITFTIMCTFTCFALSRFRNRVTGHGLAGMVGLLAVAMGIASAFGIVILCQVKFVSTVGVLPFLILGVAIDDMFIILDELDRTDFNLETRELLATVLSNVGGTVTMTTLTDLVAFAVSTMSVFPAIRIFCTYAAVAITFSYLMIMTFFVAFLVYEVKRIKQGRFDTVPFIKSTTFTIDKENGLICDAKKQVSTVVRNLPSDISLHGWLDPTVVFHCHSFVLLRRKRLLATTEELAHEIERSSSTKKI